MHADYPAKGVKFACRNTSERRISNRAPHHRPPMRHSQTVSLETAGADWAGILAAIWPLLQSAETEVLCKALNSRRNFAPLASLLDSLGRLAAKSDYELGIADCEPVSVCESRQHRTNIFRCGSDGKFANCQAGIRRSRLLSNSAGKQPKIAVCQCEVGLKVAEIAHPFSR